MSKGDTPKIMSRNKKWVLAANIATSVVTILTLECSEFDGIQQDVSCEDLILSVWSRNHIFNYNGWRLLQRCTARLLFV